MMMSKLFSLAEFWYLEGHTQKRKVAGMKARTNLRFSTENTRRATKKIKVFWKLNIINNFTSQSWSLKATNVIASGETRRPETKPQSSL